VQSSGFHPTVVVGIRHGGAEVGKIIAEELGVPFKPILVKRILATYLDKIVHGHPRVFRNRLVARIARSVISAAYRASRPRTIAPLKERLSPDDRVLVVDDSAGKGPTSQEAKRHVIESGALEQNVKIAVLQTHPEYRLKERPDYSLGVGNPRFPWDKASIVQTGNNPRESFERLDRGKTRLFLRKDVAKALLEQGIENPALLIENAPGPKTPYGRNGAAAVGLRIPGVPDRVVVKKFRRSGASRLGKASLEILPAWTKSPENAVRMGEEFLERGVLTPEPIAVVERRVYGLWKRAYLVAKEAQDTVTLSRFLREEKNWATRRQAISLVAKAVRGMHDAGLTHGNLTPYNVWIRREPRLTVYLGDLDKAHAHERVSTRERIRELGRFNALIKPYVTLKHRLLFWREYAKDDPQLRENERKHFDEIERESRKVRRKYSLK